MEGDNELTKEENEAVDNFVYRLGCETAFGDGIVVSKDEAIKFLMARKFDVGRAISLFHTNRMLRGKFELEGMNPDTDPLLSELQSGKFTVSSGKGPNGETICVFYARRHFPKEVDHVTVLRSIVLQLDYTMNFPEAQRHGLSLIYDMTSSAYKNFDFDLAMKVLHLLKGGYPARLKHVYILEAPFWFRASMTILSSFLRDKIKDRVEVVKSFPELWVKIAPKYLPKELGGDFEHNHNEWLKQCTSHFNQHGSTINLCEDTEKVKKPPRKSSEHSAASAKEGEKPAVEVTEKDSRGIFENIENHLQVAEPVSVPPTIEDVPPPKEDIPPPVNGDLPPPLPPRVPFPSEDASQQPLHNSDGGAPSKALPPEPLRSVELADGEDFEPPIESNTLGHKARNIEELLLYMKQVGKKGIFREYEELRSLPPAGVFESTMYPVNTKKNRYNNILTFEETRVKLKRLEDDPFSDYINANYVDGFDEQRKFICTQGPTPHTFVDFWRMVWEKNVAVVVMVTKCVERNRIKCGNYWPQALGDVREFGNFTVEHVEQDVGRDFTVSKLLIFDMESEMTRNIYHIRFTSWPDFGVLSSAYPILDAMNLIEKFQQEIAAERDFDNQPEQQEEQQQSNGFVQQQQDLEGSGEYATLVPMNEEDEVNDGKLPPVVIHCSAGVGRTGTFCCISNCVESLCKTGKVDVFSTVRTMREQRAFSVQTPEQYQFCYTGIIEYTIRTMSEQSEDTSDMKDQLMDFLQREVSSDSD